MKRLPDWHARLYAELDAARSRPFRWGAHDCCCFAARCVDAMTGGNLLESGLGLVPSPVTRESLQAEIAAAGGLRQLVNSFLGDSVPWGRAAPGDVVLVLDHADVEVMGICEGPQVLCATAPTGYAPIDISRAVCAWRVE